MSLQEHYIEELQETMKKLKMSYEQKQEELDGMILERKKSEKGHNLMGDAESEIKRLEKQIQENEEIFRLVRS